MRILLSLFIGLSLSFPVQAANTDTSPTNEHGTSTLQEVKHYTLDNGLQVLFLHDRRAPIVTVQVFYHVGSKDEAGNRRGMAHLFEHMMFKGSMRVRPEDHARFIDSLGGNVNGFTTEDVTAYINTLPADHLEFALKLEAERMRSLRITPQTVHSEREVVKEEKRLRIDQSPMGQMQERFFDLAYTQHPYAWTPAGIIADLNQITPEECQTFYDRYYVPNNATLIIVGDVQEKEVRSWVDTYFAPLARGPDIPRIDIVEPLQTEKRTETVDFNANLPVILGGYPIPAADNPDIAALRVMAAILSEGETARLTKRLVHKERLALAAGGYPRIMEQPGLFLIFAVHLPHIASDKVESALLSEIERLRRDGITTKELERAQKQLTLAYFSELTDITGVGTTLGYYQYVFGGWQTFFDSLHQFQKITTEDVKRVANTYLLDSHLTLITLKSDSSRNKQ